MRARVILLILLIAPALLAASACTADAPAPTTTPTPTLEPAVVTVGASGEPRIAGPSHSPATATPESTPTPVPTSTPSPDYSAEQAISWLRDAGLEVEVLEDAPSVRDKTVRRVKLSVEGDDRVSAHEFNAANDHDTLGAYFCLICYYASEGYPNLIAISNVVIVVRGSENPLLPRVYQAVWHTKNTSELLPFGLTTLSTSDLPEKAIAERAATNWLRREARQLVPDFDNPASGDARLVRLRDYTARLSVDVMRASRLPHADSLVWAVPINDGAESRAVVLVDFASQLVAGLTSEPSMDAVQNVPEPTAPVTTQLEVSDGATSLTPPIVKLSWRRFGLGESSNLLRTERVARVAIERAPAPDGPWVLLDVVEFTDLGRTASASDGAVVYNSGDAPVAVYWDKRVEPGDHYYYRVYACTDLSRRTAYSTVADMTVVDPDPNKPRPEFDHPPRSESPPC